MAKRIDRKRTIWSDPDGFSILDLLALLFTCVFLALAIFTFIFINSGRVSVLQIMVPLVSIILTGYFGDQITKRFAERKKEVEVIEQTGSNPENQ